MDEKIEKIEYNVFTFFVFLSFGFIIYLEYAKENSSSVQCFDCSGLRCGDPFTLWSGPGVTRTNCSTLCYKARTQDGFTTRGCAATAISTGCTQDDKGTICACSDDLCNSVHRMEASVVTTGVVSVLTMLVIWTIWT